MAISSSLFEQNTGKYYFDTELRATLFTFLPFYMQIKQAALVGKNVLLDTVLEYESAYQEFNTFFQNMHVIKVLIYCPLQVVVQRVQERNNSGDVTEKRFAFQSFEQFIAMYKVQEEAEEQIVDVINTIVLINALDNAIHDLIQQGISEPYQEKLQKFKHAFISQFKLDSMESVSITPKHRYDLVLSSGIERPEVLAHKLYEFLFSDKQIAK